LQEMQDYDSSHEMSLIILTSNERNKVKREKN